MLYSDSLREMMQNGLNESFWDGLGVEIGACAKFRPKNAFFGDRKKLWGLDARGVSRDLKRFLRSGTHVEYGHGITP